MLNNAGAIATYSLPHGTLTANYGYSYSKRKIIDQWGTTFYRGQFNSGELYLVQDLIDKVKFLAGVNYQTYRLLDTTLDKKNPQTNIVSPYLSLFIQDLQGLNLEVGGRYNHHSEFGERFTYNISASYLIAGNYKVFANVSSGFRAPTVNDLFGPINFGSNPDLKPETSTNFEAGAQASTSDKTLQVTATGFYRDIKNLITYVGTRLINIDKQKDKGVELEASVKPNEKWTVKASYMFVTGNLHQTRSGKDTSFYNLVRRPKHTITGTVGYQATQHLYISLSAQSLGKRTDLYFDPFTYASSQVNLKAYTLLNAYAEYKLIGDKLRLFIDAKNLTDTDYTEVYGYNAPGINVNGGFRINL
jgi:vitamin B12 transporter